MDNTEVGYTQEKPTADGPRSNYIKGDVSNAKYFRSYYYKKKYPEIF